MPIARETPREAEVLDEFASCMGHEYRRRILFTLFEVGNGDPLIVPEDLLDDALDPDQFNIELTHAHLPMLEETGYIDWDRKAGIVEEGEEFEKLEALLEVLVDHYDRIVPTVTRS